MKKELIYFLYIFTIIAFVTFVGTYYFSEKNKKYSHRSTKLYEDKITNYNEDMMILENDTENIIEYVENNLNKNKKKYKFWDLLKND
tara:strand:+ start:804 stop:1064 length:261 start_codon:yes stop_codon:yes gene_type:complete